MASRRWADQGGPGSFRGPSALRLWLSVALLVLPGWRVPGNKIADVQSVRCPFGHGWQEMRTDRSARCDGCVRGWFLWTTCPHGDELVASESGKTWRCHANDAHRFDGRLCPECSSLGFRQDDGSWRCAAFYDHVFWTARRNCGECGFGIPAVLAGGRRWVCPACDFWEEVT